jgi:hypothetical protein
MLNGVQSGPESRRLAFLLDVWKRYEEESRGEIFDGLYWIRRVSSTAGDAGLNNL